MGVPNRNDRKDGGHIVLLVACSIDVDADSAIVVFVVFVDDERYCERRGWNKISTLLLLLFFCVNGKDVDDNLEQRGGEYGIGK